jgi:hypothetical protein
MKKNDYSALPKSAAIAFDDAISQFGEKTYEWLAHLWEPEIGGFYYSNSGRDHEGFLPDIESTCQALDMVQTLGMLDFCGRNMREGLPMEMQKKVLAFAEGLQAEDGLFYHPQWGKNISASRRGRDNTWATDIIRELGGSFKYPLVAEQIKTGGERMKELPDYMRSEAALTEYLDSFDIMNKSYYMGNTVGSQLAEISAAGLRHVVKNYYVEHQVAGNGLWQESVNYHGVNGLMKISGMFVKDCPFPNHDAAINSAIEVMLSDEIPGAVVDFYNPWRASGMIMESLRNAGMEEEADRQLNKLRDIAGDLVRKTAEKMSDFIKPDGSASYFRHFTSSESQRAKVALYKAPEGDVNATAITIRGSLIKPMEMLGVKDAGIYDKSDFDKFIKLIEAQKPPVKKPQPIPST